MLTSANQTKAQLLSISSLLITWSQQSSCLTLSVVVVVAAACKYLLKRSGLKISPIKNNKQVYLYHV